MYEPENTRLLLRPEEAARRLGISRTVLFDLVRTGQLDSLKIGRSRRIPVSALEKFVENL